MKWRTLARKPVVRAAVILLVGAAGLAGLLPAELSGALRELLLAA